MVGLGGRGQGVGGAGKGIGVPFTNADLVSYFQEDFVFVIIGSTI